MTPIPQMTDAELRLAIAEIIAKANDWIVYRADWSFRKSESVVGPGSSTEALRFVSYIPNYPDDVAAAIGLLIRKVYGYVLTDKSITIQTQPHINIEPPVMHYNTSESIARAICEAWLAAKGKL